MKLIREYRLHGFLFGLLFVISLWAWRSASPLAPGSEALQAGDERGAVSGEDSGAGFVRLLRKSIPVSELFSTCTRLWSETHLAKENHEKRNAVEKLEEMHKTDPKAIGVVTAYREVVSLLRRR